MPEINETEERQKRINALLVSLRGAITALSTKAPTSVRMILDGYLPRLSPSLADAGDSAFPVTVRSHHTYKQRTIAGSKYDTLFFYVGKAVLTYYRAVQKGANEFDVQNFEDATTFLVATARDGFDSVILDGSDALGYRLVSKTFLAMEEKLADELRNSQKQAALSGVDNTGGKRSGNGVTPLPKRKSNVVHSD